MRRLDQVHQNESEFTFEKKNIWTDLHSIKHMDHFRRLPRSNHFLGLLFLRSFVDFQVVFRTVLIGRIGSREYGLCPISDNAWATPVGSKPIGPKITRTWTISDRTVGAPSSGLWIPGQTRVKRFSVCSKSTHK